MSTALLRSKLQIPGLSPEILPRPHLITAIDRAVPQQKLVLISSPAGYGKTTVLTAWARATPTRVAWLSITGDEDDPTRFMRYLIAAWRAVEPRIVETPLGVMLGSLAPDMNAVLSAFLDAAADVDHDLAFVLDDYHLLQDPAIHKAVTFLLDHLPQKCISSSPVVVNPCYRWRATGRVASWLSCGRKTLNFPRRKAPHFSVTR